MTLLRSTSDAGLSISEQLFKQAEAMAAYALSSGLRVPGSILETVAGRGRPERCFDGW